MKSDKLIFKTGCYITSGWRQRYDGTALSTGRGCNLSLMGAVFCPLQPQRVSLPLCPPLLPPILIIPSFIFPLHLLSLSCFFPSYLLHYYIYIFSPFSRSIYFLLQSFTQTPFLLSSLFLDYNNKSKEWAARTQNHWASGEIKVLLLVSFFLLPVFIVCVCLRVQVEMTHTHIWK